MREPEAIQPAASGQPRSKWKTLLKWGFRLLILLMVLLVAAALLFDTIITSLAESRIRTATGLDVKIGKLDIGVIHPKLTLENFKLYNAEEFGGAPMIDLAELHLEYDRDALRARKLRLKLVRFNLAELNLVKSRTGRTNIVDLFAKLQTMKLRKTNETEIEFAGVDSLNLTLGKIIRTDLSQSSPPREFDFRMKNKIITGLKTEQDVQDKLLPVFVRAGIALLTEGLFQPPKAPVIPLAGEVERSGGKPMKTAEAPSRK